MIYSIFYTHTVYTIVTKSIIEMHGGKVGAVPNPENHGYKFYFEVPILPFKRMSADWFEHNYISTESLSIICFADMCILLKSDTS